MHTNTLVCALTYFSIHAQSQSHLRALSHTYTPHKNTHAHTHALVRTTHIYIYIYTHTILRVWNLVTSY